MLLTAEEISLTFLSFTVAVVAVVGNVLVCIVILRVKTLRTPMNYLLLNFAIMDAITGLFATPSTILHSFILSENQTVLSTLLRKTSATTSTANNICRITRYSWLSVNGSPVLLMFIAYERYMAVVHPFSRRGGISKARLRWILPIFWVFSLGISFGFSPYISYSSKMGDCVQTLSIPFQISMSCILFFVPTVVMSVLYYKVVRKLWKSKINVANQVQQRSRLEANRKTTTTILIVNIWFIVCWGCIFISGSVTGFSVTIPTWKNPYRYQILLACLNSAVNPIIYILRLKSFRSGFRELFHCCPKNGVTNGHKEFYDVQNRVPPDKDQENNGVSLVSLRSN